MTPAEVEDLFGPVGFSISSSHEWYRRALILKREFATEQIRVGGRPTPDADRLGAFAEALNRWLPSNCHRLLWVDHWHNDYPNIHAVFAVARAGLGEKRSLSETPGHCFDAHPYDNADQVEMSSEQAQEVGLIAGFLSLAMIAAWDAWLVAERSIDRIEFWEGNIFFHSSDPTRIASAETLLTQFDCSRVLK